MNNRKQYKILFITGSLNQGGAEFQILSLAKLFKENGNEVEVFALTDYSFYFSYVKENNLKYNHLLNDQSKFKRVLLTKRKISDYKPDWVISYLKEPSIVAMLCKLIPGRSFKLLVSERTSLVLGWYDRFYFNFLLIANKITTNSISKLDYIQRRFPLLKKRSFFVPNIIDIGKFTVANNERLTTEICRLAFVGRLAIEKNLTQLIIALSILAKEGFRFSFKMYGRQTNKVYFNEIQSLISKFGLTNFVEYMGPSSNVLEVYKNTDVLCLVSKYEGLSNVIAEAIASGLPVIASNIEENKLMVKDGYNGYLVDASTPDGIAIGLEKFFLLSDEQRAAMSYNSQQLAANLFDSDKIYSRYMELLQ